MSRNAGETLLLWAPRRPSRAILCAGCVAELCGALAANAYAQTVPLAATNVPQLAPPPTIAGRLYEPPTPSREYTALALGSWLLYPSLSGGLFYDTNVDQLPSGHDASIGLRLVPNLLAMSDNGIEKTTVYGLADGQAGSAAADDTVAANAGIVETYTPLRDLSVTAQGDYLRQKDLFSIFAINNNVGYLNPTGVGLAPTIEPQSYNQETLALSTQKTFYRAFAGLGVSAVELDYDRSGGVAAAPSGLATIGTARGGFWMTPFLYGYAEASLDKRSYATSALGSSGYRTVIGIGSSQVRFFRGQIYAGYEAESYRAAAIGTVGGWVFGGRGEYAPLPNLNAMASLDESLGASLLAPASVSIGGTATRVTAALLSAQYAFAPDLSASGRAGYIRTDYINNPRRDDAWTVGATLTYGIWRNFGLSLDYQHVELTSNVPAASFSRDVVTIGGTYKY